MDRLVELVQRLGREINQASVGRAVEVMVERPSKQGNGLMMGRTRGHKPVNFPSDSEAGELLTVELLEATSTSFGGRVVGPGEASTQRTAGRGPGESASG
jgi:tRNA-2-methylthio-N6-dimethylallyladenosine synthase